MSVREWRLVRPWAAGVGLLAAACCTTPAAEGNDRPRAISLADTADGAGEDAAGTAEQGRKPPASAGAAALREALRATVAGAETARAERLAAALAAAPHDPTVRGAAGQVRRGTRWVDYDTLVEEARGDRRLAEYRARRADAAPTVAGQLALADWCRSQRLSAQERAHLEAVVGLDPDHAAARRRLGDVRRGGGWITAAEAAAHRTADRAVADALRRHRAKLTALAGRIGDGSVSHDEGVTLLAGFVTPAGIVAMETYLSTANEPASRCVIAALADTGSPAATASLVRHAVVAPWPAVRREATRCLATRDPHASVPLLLTAFEAPWRSEIGFAAGIDGSLLCRQTTLSEGPDRVRLGVHDHLVVTGGRPDTAADEAIRQAAMVVAIKQAERESDTLRIAATNDAVAAVLQVVSGESIGADPDEWWRWWESKAESFTDGPRTYETSYTSSSSYAEGRGNVTVTRRPRPPCECLAGGTLVWTETGPVAVDRIRPGDVVVAQDPWSGALALAPVLRTTVRPPEKLLVIQAGGDVIRATGGHPFWTVGTGWRIARELRPGDRLHGLDAPVAIDSITEDEEPVRTFNLVVADQHSYFCGPAKVLSHDNSPRTHAAHPLPGLAE